MPISRRLLLALCLSAARADMKLYMLPTAQYNATCSDGSPVGYYLKPAPKGGQKTKLTIWIKGGDKCNSYKDCVDRQSKVLGSSKYWPQAYQGVAMQDSNKTENPDFFDWNHVYIEYCSGDLWSGTQVEPVNPWPGAGPVKFAFAGHLHLSQVIDHVLSEAHGVEPTEVLFTGGSAGGIGAFQHADWLTARLPASTKVRTVPQGGLFGDCTTDYTHFAHKTADPDPCKVALSDWMLQVPRYVSPAEAKCTAALPPSSPFAACAPTQYYPYIAAPLFIVQASVDWYQVFALNRAPKTALSNPTVGAYVEYQRSVQAGNITQIVLHGPKTASDGLFAPACLGHTTAQMGWLGTTRQATARKGQNPKVDGLWAAQAVGNWYFGRGGASHMHLDNNDDLATLCKCNPKVCG